MMYKNKKMIYLFFIVIILAFSYVYLAMPSQEDLTGDARRILRRGSPTMGAKDIKTRCVDNDNTDVSNVDDLSFYIPSSIKYTYQRWWSLRTRNYNDYCRGNYLYEYYCDGNNRKTKKILCENGCELINRKGACMKEDVLECLDPDGNDAYVKGTTTGVLPGPGEPRENLGSQTDKCAIYNPDGSTEIVDSCTGDHCGVEEFICKYSDQLEIDFVSTSMRYCTSAGCTDGACISLGDQPMTGTFRDGDAYIGESLMDPDWVWNIAPDGVIGIENDFVIDDDSDNPPGIGECLKLPNDYASICFNGLTVADEDYLTVTIEYADSEDLEESGHEEVTTSEETIHISAPGDDRFELKNGKYTSEIWLAKIDDGLAIFYNDPSVNPRIVYWKTITSPGESICNDINYGQGSYDIDINMPATVSVINVRLFNGVENINAQFKYDSNDIVSLGNMKLLEEANELSWRRMDPVQDYVQIGTKDEDHRTAYGTVIKDPRRNGRSDKVVLEIPKEQVKGTVELRPFSDQAGVQLGKSIAGVEGDTDLFLDYNEHNLILNRFSPSLETSLTSFDDDYENGVFMEFRKDAVRCNYMYQFQTDEKKVINFLGNELTVTYLGEDKIKIE